MTNPQHRQWIAVGPLADLQRDGVKLVRGADRPIAVFAHQNAVHAVDNRCPHLGFPLTKGTVHDGILTCHWHQARFDLCSGCTFDLWADDIPPFLTRVENGQVFVAALPEHDPERHRRQLTKGLTQNIGLLQAKGIVGMLADGAPAIGLIRTVLAFGMEHQNTSGGLTELAIAGNLAPALKPQTLYFMLNRASQQIGQASANSRRQFREPLAGKSYAFETLEHWFNQWILVRDREAAERVLLTAIKHDCTPAQLTQMLVGAESQRIFSGGGHPIDVINKSMELLDRVGWDHAAQVLPLTLPQMVAGRGTEEEGHWRHPVDLIELIRTAEARLPAALAAGDRKRWEPDPAAEAALAATLFGDDPRAIIEALLAALTAGAPPEQLSQRVCLAAAMRLARFAPGNEVGDWFNPQHTFTYANAVDQLIGRHAPPTVVRTLFHAAMSVYMDRFLNIPPAKLPEETSDLADLPSDADTLLAKLLDELDGRAQSNSAARVVSRYLLLNHPVDRLVDTLALATLREDLDFHTLQVLDAGVRQARQWGDHTPQARHIFVGVIRNLAAVCPTPRARNKTAMTALKLHHGESMHEEA